MHDYDIIDTHCVTVVIMLIVYLFLSFLFLSFLPLFFFSLLLCLPFPSLSLVPYLFLSSSPSFLSPPSFLSSCPSLPLRLLIMLKWSTNPWIPLLAPPPPLKSKSKHLQNLPNPSMMTRFSILPFRHRLLPSLNRIR